MDQTVVLTSLSKEITDKHKSVLQPCVFLWGRSVMHYKLAEDVFIVNGCVKSCLYDLKRGKLYSLNRHLADRINQINNEALEIESIEEDLQNVLRRFVDLGLLDISTIHEKRNIDEIKEKDTGIKFAWIEITSKCNLRCKHCYNESDVRCDSVMSLSDFKYVIDYLIQLKVPKIQIIGGEPFFDKKLLKEMLDYACGKFEFIEIFTNGTLIFEEEWFEYLKKNDIHIALSVYSYNSADHDGVTGQAGTLNKTNETIKNLKERDIPYRVCNVLMKDVSLGKKNNDLYTLSEKKDIVRMSGRASFELLDDELIGKKLITKESFSKTVTKAFCRRLISGHNCFRSKIYISADLEVYPCVMERRMNHGSLKDDNFSLSEKIRYFSKEYVEECSQCEYRYACYDCRPDAISMDINAKPWYCTYNPALGEWEDKQEFIVKLKRQYS